MQQFYIPDYCLKRLFMPAITLFLSIQAYTQVFPVDTLMRNGQRSNRINIAYLAEGYQSAQLDTFNTNSITINDALFSEAPYFEYKNFFNSFSINVPSIQSGATHPHTAPDCPSLATQPIASPTTYFQCTFDFFSIHRLLVPLNNGGVSSVLASNIPDYDIAFVVVNSPYYGGSGGGYATASTDASSAEVAIHEIGHSFGNLADEYWAGDSYAAERVNMTAENDPDSVKWKNWMGINGIGIYTVGTTAGGMSWYRPHQSCKMQLLGQPFCSVCKEALIERIHQLVNMVDSISPSATSFILSNTDPVDFAITAVQNNPSSVGIKWYLNGSAAPFATDQTSVSVPFNSFSIGSNTIKAEVTDSTTLSKTYLPGAGYVNSITWNVTRPAVVPVILKSFAGKVNNQTGLLNWEIETPGDLESFELEKSKDGISYSSLAIITGQSQKKSYNYSDPVLAGRYIYYRLKMILKSGTNLYSNVIRLQNNAFDKFNYKVYQQAETKSYHLTVSLMDPQKISMQVRDGNGRRIMRKDFGNVETQLDFDFNLAGKPAGIYYMSLNIDNKNYTVQLVAR